MCLKAFVKKLLERSPSQFNLTKAVSNWDPFVAAMANIRNNRLKNHLTILENNNWIDGAVADRADREFRELCSQPIVGKSGYRAYSMSEKRVDHFWRDVIHENGNPKSVEISTKIVMILSHGNANVERSFSVNSECLVDNMKNKTLVAQRMVYDSIMAACGDLSDYSISRSLLLSYRNAQARLIKETEKRQKKAKAIKENYEICRKRLAKEKSDLEAKKAQMLAEVQAIDEQINTMKQ